MILYGDDYMELLLCFVIIFTIITFVLSIKEISYKKVFYKHKSNSIIIIPLYVEDFSEIYLKHYIEVIKNSEISVYKVILIDNGLTLEQRQISDNIIKHNDMIEFINTNDLSCCIEALLK